LVCPANIRKNSRNAAFLPRDLCFIGKKVQDARQTSKDVGVNVEGDLEAAKNTAERIMDQQLANR
jgi:hypothetical protein